MAEGGLVGGHESDHVCLLPSHKATGVGQQLGVRPVTLEILGVEEWFTYVVDMF